MEISIPVNHNYYEELPLVDSQLEEAFGVKPKSKKEIKELFSSVFELKLGNNSLNKINIFGFKESSNFKDDIERLVLKLYSKTQVKNNEKQYIVQTGLYAGVLYHKGCKFNITTKYGDVFLNRMLNFVNDIYIDNQEFAISKEKKVNEFEYIIAFLFIQSLEKAASLGLPKEYQTHKQRSHKVRGKIDINQYLKKDIPFQGKLTTTFREQTYVQEIIDVLYFTCKKLERKFGREINNKLLGISQVLKQYFSGNWLDYETINRARNHKVLANPLFTSFKKVLNYAEIILKEESVVSSDNQNDNQTTGFLFDISQLFEVYLEKLLNSYFSDWHISAQTELNLYNGKFYHRRMFPDIVLTHKNNNKVVVFDAKFKTMRFIKNDLDRSDFYQIHSYIQYYEPEVILGGLIYPLSKELNKTKTHSDQLFGLNGRSDIKFIVDGIYMNEEMNMRSLIEEEINFLKRIELCMQ